MSLRVVDHGIGIALPDSWEGRIFVRPQPAAGGRITVRPGVSAHRDGEWVDTPGDRTTGAGTAVAGPGRNPGRWGWAGEITRPIMHAGNFALPADRGDYGSGAVDVMRQTNLFIALLEFGPESVGTPLFAQRGVPQPANGEFGPNNLQRRLPGQLGYQRFFTLNNRAFCAYVVLGGTRYLPVLADAARAVLATTEVS